MRADRLVAALLLLQSRARLTAADLARELEVSERTARRDLEALAMAGVPVYSQAGRSGGWSLVGGARTDLSGLTAAEARTLFLVAGPRAVTPEMTTALRKLVRALPETFRKQAEAAAGAVVHDTADWDRAPASPPAYLGVLQNAIIDGVQVRLRYAGRDSPPSERMVHPLGLVAKGPVWYLVANTEAGQRTFRLSRIRGAEATTLPADRPEGFDLDEAWRSILQSLDERRLKARAMVHADGDFVGILKYVMGTRVTVVSEATATQRAQLEVRGHSAYILAAQLAGFAEHIEVVEPAEVRDHLARLGGALSAQYGPRPAPAGR